ncbi:hypothetical protein HMPREF0298_0647 [Corynebacterium lipophiloflavum DSM 44291]|uniref:Sulphur transport domain-containing protein n=1 Tax=Corynebacterium lipophiloflavum (strain ATCC 700352 / DSM 44291 / CCUG 37336 / JCM 10383 / DMMZ 1944) TaxID=525263 RepID=C0XQC7_CORLD|nr:hypothetical protein HMPREF0298_0647 [Corynebacterium lipophiloflavum DSM 44291]
MLASGLVVGAALGAIMQRGRFCVTGMLRDVFLQKRAADSSPSSSSLPSTPSASPR